MLDRALLPAQAVDADGVRGIAGEARDRALVVDDADGHAAASDAAHDAQSLVVAADDHGAGPAAGRGGGAHRDTASCGAGPPERVAGSDPAPAAVSPRGREPRRSPRPRGGPVSTAPTNRVSIARRLCTTRRAAASLVRPRRMTSSTASTECASEN